MRNYVYTALVVVALGSAALAVGCYNPDVKNGAFSCSMDLGNACPGGFVCAGGLCVKPTAQDLSLTPLDLAGDQAVVQFVPTCDDFVAQGKFANLTALTAVNTAADEGHIALDTTTANWRLLFERSGTLYASALSGAGHHTAGAPAAVVLTGGPTTVNGGSFTADGKLWLSGTTGGTTALYTATSTGATSFTVAAPLAAPTSTGCAFSDPVFYKGVASNDMSVGLEMYASFALGGCSGQSYVVLGAEGRNIGAFVSALPSPGFASPSLTPTGNGLIVASTPSPASLSIGRRSGPGFQFDAVQPIPMNAIGASTEDRQAVVSADCSLIVFSSVRSGGQGGADLYAADIVQQ